MKKQMQLNLTQRLLVLVIFLLPAFTKAQSHKLVYECPVYSCDINGENVSQTFAVAPEGSKFDSIRPNQDGDIIIIFRKWTPPKATDDTSYVIEQLRKISLFNYKLAANDIRGKIDEANTKSEKETASFYFIIKKKDFGSLTEKLNTNRWDIAAGALTIPFKLRDKPFDFSKDITLAGTAAFGYEFTKNFTMYITGSMGISSIALDSANTKGLTKKPTNLSAFTLSPGLVFAWKKLHVSINYGRDYLGHSDSDKGWIYNKKGWLGIGIGYRLFIPEGKETKKASSEEKQK